MAAADRVMAPEMLVRLVVGTAGEDRTVMNVAEDLARFGFERRRETVQKPCDDSTRTHRAAGEATRNRTSFDALTCATEKPKLCDNEGFWRARI